MGFHSDIDAICSMDAVPKILDVICQTTGMGFAAVARVTEERWITCQSRDDLKFGLGPGDELEVKTTICNEIRMSNQLVVIDHVDKDVDFKVHPTPLQYGFQSYISVPIIRSDGSFFGTLCAIDPKPRQLNNPQTISTFELFAELIATQLDTYSKLLSTQNALDAERHTAELREQFIAVLSHDLRNPLAAIGSGANLLLRNRLDEKSVNIVELIQGSVDRMDHLISNLLDFARARLGNGLEIEREHRPDLKASLQQVVDEISLTSDRTVTTSFDLDDAIVCDDQKISQLLSNLLGNALRHGAPGTPVRVTASSSEDSFQLTVANDGTPIPEALLSDLFKPFSRGDGRAGQGKGLGLGLFICNEIARAHDGHLKVKSSGNQTRFTFSMPVDRKVA